MIDTAPLLEAILASGSAPLACEEAGRLIEGLLAFEDTLPERIEGWGVTGVEVPFYVRLEENSFAIGVVDAIFSTKDGHVFAEWKSRRAPKLTKAGKPYEGDDEDGWLEGISNGPQLAFYALAAREGAFLPFKNLNEDIGFAIPSPRILVRAVVKSTPVEVWPKKDWRKGVFQFHPAGIDAARAALTVKCRQIREARRSELIPWQIVGDQCTNMYRRVCGNREGVCKQHLYPPRRTGPNPNESETRKLIAKALGLDLMDPELVMLSASGFATFTQCMELGRERYEAEASGPAEDSFELQVGGAMHQALAAYYRSFK